MLLLLGVVATALNPPRDLVSAIFGYALIGSIPVYSIVTLISKKSGVIFTREYREILAQTRHIKHKTSRLVKIIVGLLLAVLGIWTLVALYIVVFKRF
jgi:hypothetical protein